MARKGQVKSYCKYGHLKAGDNLMLRERVHKDGREQVERVCRICLNRQKRDWDARQAMLSSYKNEQAIRAKLKYQAIKEMSRLTTKEEEL